MRVEIPRYGSNLEVRGLPANGKAIAISNSERHDATCALRWWFRHGQGLRRPGTLVMRRGEAFHELMADLYGWHSIRQEPYPQGADSRFFEDLCARWLDEIHSSPQSEFLPTEEEVDKEIDRLTRIAEGYLHRYGRNAPSQVRVTGVEVKLAAPVLGPDGKPYRPKVPLHETRSGWRFARPGEEVTWVRWPWYQVGTLDVTAQGIESGKYWFYEHKTTQDPEGYIRGLTVDPQVAGYLYLLKHAYELSTEQLGGYVYNVVSTSYQYDPQVLKQRKPGDPIKLSTAKNRTVPSWRFRRTVHQMGLDPAPYEEHVRWLRENVDPRLHRREWGSLGEGELERYQLELYGVARRIAQMRRDVVRAETPVQVARLFPRTPVCRLPGGGCAYAGPCANDCAEAREGYEVQDGPVWSDGTESEQEDIGF